MGKIIQFLIKFVMMVLVVQLNTACSEEEANGSASGSSGGGTPIDSTPIGEVEATGFWVNVTSTEHPVLVNQSTSFGTDCFIDADTTTNQFMTCYVDMLEGDLGMYDIDLQYNVPPSLCDHVRTSTAWHWNYSSGVGPKVVNVAIDSSTTPITFTSCTAERDSDDTMINCNVHPELFDTSNPAGPTCYYNKTESGGKNCCFGEYTLTVTDAANGGTPLVTKMNWGGDVGACIGGAGKTSWSAKSPDGYPSGLIQPIPEGSSGDTEGLNDKITLKASTSNSVLSYSSLASFYETSGTPHSHAGYVSATTTSRPYAINPIDDLDGTLYDASTGAASVRFLSGSDAHYFSCLDEAFEVKHAIRVQIREWNSLLDFVAYETSSGATYNPDTVGSENGTTCGYDPQFGSPCNDFEDFADILTEAGGSYTLNNTMPPVGTHPALIREKYFPEVSYD